MELIDTHCHLYFDPLANDVPGVLGRARAEGVVQVVVPVYDLSSWETGGAGARGWSRRRRAPPWGPTTAETTRGGPAGRRHNARVMSSLTKESPRLWRGGS